MSARRKSLVSEKASTGANCVHRLVRRCGPASRLDFEPAVAPCECGGKLAVKDHRIPGFEPTASLEWRYEVVCESCSWCDCNGYQTRREVLDVYTPNEKVSDRET